MLYLKPKFCLYDFFFNLYSFIKLKHKTSSLFNFTKNIKYVLLKSSVGAYLDT